MGGKEGSGGESEQEGGGGFREDAELTDLDQAGTGLVVTEEEAAGSFVVEEVVEFVGGA